MTGRATRGAEVDLVSNLSGVEGTVGSDIVLGKDFSSQHRLATLLSGMTHFSALRATTSSQAQEGTHDPSGGGGNDCLIGRGSSNPDDGAGDQGYGGNGDDLIEAAYAYGGIGHDLIDASGFYAWAYGGAGNDTIALRTSGGDVHGETGDDVITSYGEFFLGRVYGGEGNDVLTVTHTTDGGFVDGGAGNDRIDLDLAF